MTSADTYTQTLHTLVPVAHSLGIEALEWNPQQVRLRLSWAADRCTAGGVLHGGVIMTLADTAGAVCAYAGLLEGASTTTIESKDNGAGDPSSVVPAAKRLGSGRVRGRCAGDLHAPARCGASSARGTRNWTGCPAR